MFGCNAIMGSDSSYRGRSFTSPTKKRLRTKGTLFNEPATVRTRKWQSGKDTREGRRGEGGNEERKLGDGKH